MSRIAAKLLKFRHFYGWDGSGVRYTNQTNEIHALAASCLSQYETKGPRK